MTPQDRTMEIEIANSCAIDYLLGKRVVLPAGIHR